MDTSSVIRAVCGTALAVGAAYGVYKSYKWMSSIMARVAISKKILENKLMIYSVLMRFDEATVGKIMVDLAHLESILSRLETDHFSVTDEELAQALELSISLYDAYGAPSPITVPAL